MIVSHKYRYIFLKTNKTAGTSIEIALSRSCGVDDIITPITPSDERLRLSVGARGAQNYLERLSSYNPVDFLALLARGKKKQRYFNHMSASDAKRYLGEQIWNDYYKFCFMRNPLRIPAHSER